MGKLVTLIGILIFIDILFVITGQVALDSDFSIIQTAIFNPSNIMASAFWTVVIFGLIALGIVTLVSAGFLTGKSDIAMFFAMAGILALLIQDYLAIYKHLSSLNEVLALVVFVPIMVIFIFTILEWARGKD